MEIDDLAEVFIKLAQKGVHNLNFVTPTHFTPHLFDALIRAYSPLQEQSDISLKNARQSRQFRPLPETSPDIIPSVGIKTRAPTQIKNTFLVENLPIVYNTSGFESLEVLKLLDGMVDIYIPDIRYADNAVGKQLSKVPDYVERDRAAILEMARQVGAAPIEYGPDGMARRGLIVRHLVLPGGLAGTASSLKWLRDTLGTQVAVSLMCQYFPAHLAPTLPGLDRAITMEEYSEAVDLLDGMGFENAWAQDPDETGGA